ncbi:PD-(D/E)XK nuclease family protein [Rufibacter tibetensis]|uniref:Uncharacterized protein n=1 Tax=Rufibacter tibetensis TaxID=512763 RepID=A0A0N7HX16_9BACT|nr:PD-(D/E)XK nuclease family protein [Rufibacter tibetensis]ALJ00793.1 hypothetical protein DC20_19655 [Rufibacter tibetensis]
MIFLAKLELKDRHYTSFYIDTQCVYGTQNKRTDLEINLGHSFIMVESKIGSDEMQNQLNSYASLLAERGQQNKL